MYLYYADVKSERSEDTKDEADKCDAGWVEEGCKSGDKPWLLYGDWNREEEQSYILQHAVACGTIYNVLDRFRASRATTKKGRCIDRIYTNQLGLQMILGAKILDTAYYRGCHSAIQISIAPQALLQKASSLYASSLPPRGLQQNKY